MEQRPIIERLARHLAGNRPDEWPDHVENAASLLALIKNPDQAMKEAGDSQIWDAMIDAALRERWAISPLSADADTPGGADEEGDMRLDPDAVGRDRADWVHLKKK